MSKANKNDPRQQRMRGSTVGANSVDNTAADHKDIDFELEEADNNSRVAKPPQESDGEYDAEEFESGEEDGEDSRQYEDAQEVIQTPQQVAEAKKQAEAQRRQRQKEFEEAKLKEQEKLKKLQAQKEREAAAAQAEAQNKAKQMQMRAKQEQVDAANNRQAMMREKEQRAAQNRVPENSSPNNRLISEDDDRFGLGGRESSQGLLRQQRQEVNRPVQRSQGDKSQDARNAPIFKQYQETALFFDYSFKFISLLDSLAEIFRVTSALEGLLFFIAMIFFVIGNDRSMWYLVLALFHVARALVGFSMARVVPSSYDFVEKLEDCK